MLIVGLVRAIARHHPKGRPMANLNITYTEMSDSATRMRNNKNDIDARLTECKSIVDNLTASGFVTDQASGKFDEVHTEFVTSANQVMETLEQLSSWLDKAVDAMRDMDTQLANSLNK
ncbi:WXG100 family type VII secretion target [Actinoplanes sp. CA-015351]|uniref:WXG100 family type VII secretion target n=1 Tax=Actinoplanes sp. CA-015351 TaxID=3239897 RepID=UPI003D99431E